MKLQGNIVSGGRAGYGVIEWNAGRIGRLELGNVSVVSFSVM